jgi:hypothetical protein
MAARRHRHGGFAGAAAAATAFFALLPLFSAPARADLQRRDVIVDTSVLEGLQVQNDPGASPAPAAAPYAPQAARSAPATLTLDPAAPPPEAAALAAQRPVAPARIDDESDLGALRVFPVTERVLHREALDPNAGVSSPALIKKKLVPFAGTALDPSRNPSGTLALTPVEAESIPQPRLAIPEDFKGTSARAQILIPQNPSAFRMSASGIPIPPRKPGSGSGPYELASKAAPLAAIAPAAGSAQVPPVPARRPADIPGNAAATARAIAAAKAAAAVQQGNAQLAATGRHGLPLSAAPTRKYAAAEGYQLRGAKTMPAVPKGRVYAEPLDKYSISARIGTDPLERQLVHLEPADVVAAVEQVQKSIARKAPESAAPAPSGSAPAAEALLGKPPGVSFLPPRQVKKAKREDDGGIIRIDALRDIGAKVGRMGEKVIDFVGLGGDAAAAPEKIMAQAGGTVKTYADISPAAGAVPGIAAPGVSPASVPAPVSAPSATALRMDPAPPPAGFEQEFVTLAYEPGMTAFSGAGSAAVTQHILRVMNAHPLWRLQIQAYASPDEPGNPASAKRISLDRAMAVRSWLVSRGVEEQRVDVRALGMQTDRDPADRLDFLFFDPEA